MIFFSFDIIQLDRFRFFEKGNIWEGTFCVKGETVSG